MDHPRPPFVSTLLTAVLLLGVQFLISSSSHAQPFQKLAFQPSHETVAAGFRFQLQDPDDPSHPTLWQGPLSIAHGARYCTVDTSLVRDVYISATGKLVLVVSVSGSSTYVGFFDSATCAHRWAAIKAFTQGVSIQGRQLTLLPACACAEKGGPCSCSAGLVYALRDNASALLQPARSRALTKSRLGVAFTGTRTFAHAPAGATP